MLRPTSLCRVAVLALLLALPWSGLLAPAGAGVPQSDDPSGAPPGYHPSARAAVPFVPEGLDDLLQPRREAIPSAAPRARVSDVGEVPLLQTASRTALWERLAALAPAQRANAAVEVELGAGAGPADRLVAAQVAEAWRAGRFDEAIAALRSFEESGGTGALGISWKEGAAPASDLDRAVAAAGGTDVRIGARVGGRITSLDFDAGTGYLFAVVCWGSETGESNWTVHRSTDEGATWSETYSWSSAVGIGDVSATVVGGYLYVGYLVGNAQSELRLRRCLIPSGALDNVYGFHAVLDAAPATFNEICLASNADNSDNRIYCFGLQSDHALRFAYDESSDGTTFSQISPTVVNADFGLDATWNPNYSVRFLFMSYAGTDGNVHVQHIGGAGWTDRVLSTASGMDHRTSISAYEDVVICAYEYDYTEGRGIHYEISYDGGDNWGPGTLAIPDGIVVSSYMCPDVDARDGHGTGIVYAAEVGEPDLVYYRKRAGFAPGPWDDPEPFNDLDTSTGTRLTLSHVPVLGPTCFSHGAIYFGGGGVPYFDLPMLGTVDVPPPVAAKGVQLFPPAPSPFTDRATVRFTLPQAGQASLDVFNVQGRHVATLADGPMEGGSHSFTLDGRGLGSGVYFCRLTAGTVQRTSRFVVIR